MAWEMREDEVDYIDRQQGLRCAACANPLRAMALADTILRPYPGATTLLELCQAQPTLRLLEINTAGNLTQFFRLLPGHRLVEYPDFDMTRLALETGTFDLVVHSDSLEHVPDPVLALSECKRVLRDGGLCVFTVPILVDRLTRSRRTLPGSFHGYPGTEAADQLVHNEFGLDVSRFVLEAGFSACRISAFEYPAALVISAVK